MFGLIFKRAAKLLNKSKRKQNTLKKIINGESF